MAIKILDAISIDKFGLSIANIILTFKGSYRLNYTESNNQRTYFVHGTLYYYLDRTKDPIHIANQSYAINESQLETNLLEYMYNMIKANHENYEDL
jgi:hypothetical protein